MLCKLLFARSSKDYIPFPNPRVVGQRVRGGKRIETAANLNYILSFHRAVGYTANYPLLIHLEVGRFGEHTI